MRCYHAIRKMMRRMRNDERSEEEDRLCNSSSDTVGCQGGCHLIRETKKERRRNESLIEKS
jgi:hypothetical protein